MPIGVGTVERLASFIALSVGDLAQDLTPENAAFYFQELGVTLSPSLLADPGFRSTLAQTATAATTLTHSSADLFTAANSGDESGFLNAAGNLLAAVAGLTTTLTPLANAVGHGITPAGMLVDAIVRRFESQRPTLMSFAALLGVINRTIDLQPSLTSDFPAPTPAVAHRGLNLNRLAPLLTAPASYLRSQFNWGNSPFDPTAMLQQISTFLQLLGAPVTLTTSASGPLLRSSPVKATPNTTTTPSGLDLTFDSPIPDGFSVTIPITTGLSLTTSTKGNLPRGFTLTLIPPDGIQLVPPALPFELQATTALSLTPVAPQTTLVILGESVGSRIEASGLTFTLGVQLEAGAGAVVAVGRPTVSLSLTKGSAVFDLSAGDGFLTSLVSKATATFSTSASWSPGSPVRFDASAGLQLTLPTHITLGPIDISSLYFVFTPSSDGSFPIEISARVTGTLGPVSAAIDRVGVEAVLSFPSGGGNLGPAQLAFKFKPPSGVGIAIDAGPVTGGGFIAYDDALKRYSGALELSIYSIAVKAFGLVDTVLPDGTKGYLFVIIISAEFTPIQLGFGFTLVGVGGLVGINRTINSDALQSAVIGGSATNILFPQDVVHDAPSIINDLATFFPAAQSHYLFGPMAELGWGTPTLIRGKLGIILELLGPRLSLLGLVQMALPTAEDALISVNLAIGGLLDFPGKLFWFEAALFDSQVVSFPIQGGMAFRLTWGASPNFALAVGGFNSVFTPPQGFPDVKRCSIDVGINGNPSLTILGYFAITSNSAQVGTRIDLRASGAGVHLHGYVEFDALFIFSPFSFEADFSAGVDIRFHGVGFGISLHGKISGPTPWRVQAQACVSILFWDACLPVDFSFGTKAHPSLPQVDPWIGIEGGNNPVEGLLHAIQASTNWSGSFPTGTQPVVTLTQADATASNPPIDPVGQATLHQKVCPLNLKLTKFGIYQPIGHTVFQMVAISVHNDATGQDDSIASPTPVQDQFAPALFTTMRDSDKLKSRSYEALDSGFTIQPEQVTTESSPPSLNIAYETDLIDDQGNERAQPDFQLTMRHLTAMLGRSAAAQSGIRRSGLQRFVDPTAPVKVTLSPELFIAANGCTLAANNGVTPTAVSFRAAQNQLDDHVANQPGDLGSFRVVPSYLAA